MEIEFLTDNFERTLRHLTLDGPIENIVRSLVDRIWQLRTGNNPFDFRNIIFLIPPLPTELSSIFLRKRKIVLRNGFVVGKRTQVHGEKLSPLTGLSHPFNNPRYQFLIFFLGVLLVEDAVALFDEPHTSETIMRPGVTIVAVQKVVASTQSRGREEEVLASVHAVRNAFIAEGRGVHTVAIHAMMASFRLRRMSQLLTLEQVVHVRTILAIGDVCPRDALAIYPQSWSVREHPEEFFRLPPERANAGYGFHLHGCPECLNVSGSPLLIKKTVLTLVEVLAPDAIAAPDAIFQKSGIAAVADTSRVPAIVGVIGIHGLVAEFTVMIDADIRAVFARDGVVGVKQVLRFIERDE